MEHEYLYDWVTKDRSYRFTRLNLDGVEHYSEFEDGLRYLLRFDVDIDQKIQFVAAQNRIQKKHRDFEKYFNDSYDSLRKAGKHAEYATRLFEEYWIAEGVVEPEEIRAILMTLFDHAAKEWAVIRALLKQETLPKWAVGIPSDKNIEAFCSAYDKHLRWREDDLLTA